MGDILNSVDKTLCESEKPESDSCIETKNEEEN